MECRRLLAEEIPSRVVCGSALGDFPVWLRLDGMDQVGKLYGVLDEEGGNVIPNNVCVMSSSVLGRTSQLSRLTKVTRICIETSSEAMYISDGVWTAPASGDCREANENRRLLAGCGKKRSSCYIRPIAVARKDAMSPCSVISRLGQGR
jgi:hypothetical protein